MTESVIYCYNTSTLHTEHSTLHTAHCTLHTEHSTLHTAKFTMHTAHCTLHTAHCTQNTAHCTLHTAHCKLHTTHINIIRLFSLVAVLAQISPTISFRKSQSWSGGLFIKLGNYFKTGLTPPTKFKIFVTIVMIVKAFGTCRDLSLSLITVGFGRDPPLPTFTQDVKESFFYQVCRYLPPSSAKPF